MKIHRAVTLVLMMLLGVAAIVLMMSLQHPGSLIALVVVLVGCVLGGVVMSWKRYGARRR